MCIRWCDDITKTLAFIGWRANPNKNEGPELKIENLSGLELIIYLLGPELTINHIWDPKSIISFFKTKHMFFFIIYWSGGRSSGDRISRLFLLENSYTCVSIIKIFRMDRIKHTFGGHFGGRFFFLLKLLRPHPRKADLTLFSIFSRVIYSNNQKKRKQEKERKNKIFIYSS